MKPISNQSSPPPAEHHDESQGRTRRPYRRPRIVARETIEAVAAVCDSGAGGKEQGVCANPFS